MKDVMPPLTRRQAARLLAGASLAAATGACTRSAADAAADAATVSQSAEVPVTGLSLDNTQLQALEQTQLKRRVSGFQARRWTDHFGSLSNGGAILVDTNARALHYWREGLYKVYPVSVPLTPELTRTGRTRVVQKRVGPDWRPTPNMLRRNPDLPAYVGPGPQNPLGTHALYLSWTYYRIHGTNDERKIGRKSSNGCIGLYNEHIEELFGMASVGTEVLLV